jgi:hypothetical protein
MICSLCGLECDRYTEHHFIPKTVHSNKWFKKRYTREQMNKTTPVCRECHHAIHDLIPSEKDLGRKYNTIQGLKSNAKIKKYLKWKKRKS